MIHNREVNFSTDLKPSVHHLFEVKLIRGLARGKKILDIGCWSGQFLSILEDKSKTFGIDPDKKAVEFNKKNRNGVYKVGSALKLPFKKGTFDLVTMWDVIEHLPVNSEEKAISEISRVLKNKRYFAMCTVTRHPLSILLDPAYFLIGHRHYSKKYLVDLLKRNNMEPIKIVYSGGIWTLLIDNLNLVFKHLLGREFKSKFLDKKYKSEYNGSGFVEIHIISRKVS